MVYDQEKFFLPCFAICKMNVARETGRVERSREKKLDICRVKEIWNSTKKTRCLIGLLLEKVQSPPLLHNTIYTSPYHGKQDKINMCVQLLYSGNRQHVQANTHRYVDTNIYSLFFPFHCTSATHQNIETCISRICRINTAFSGAVHRNKYSHYIQKCFRFLFSLGWFQTPSKSLEPLDFLP